MRIKKEVPWAGRRRGVYVTTKPRKQTYIMVKLHSADKIKMFAYVKDNPQYKNLSDMVRTIVLNIIDGKKTI